jgi:hypothetical protein
MTTRFVCTGLIGVGRSRFQIEDRAECADCGKARAIAMLRARQENEGIDAGVRQRERIHLQELEAA